MSCTAPGTPPSGGWSPSRCCRPSPARTTRSSQRFRREAEAIGRLNHPHIVTVYDLGEAEGHVFMAMELLEGEDLRGLIDRAGEIPLADRVRILAQIAEGLGYAHTKDVVHRDVKPANIMVTTSGQVKLLDFGLARVVDPRDHHEARGDPGDSRLHVPRAGHGQGSGRPAERHLLGGSRVLRAPDRPEAVLRPYPPQRALPDRLGVPRSDPDPEPRDPGPPRARRAPHARERPRQAPALDGPRGGRALGRPRGASPLALALGPASPGGPPGGGQRGSQEPGPGARGPRPSPHQRRPAHQGRRRDGRGPRPRPRVPRGSRGPVAVRKAPPPPRKSKATPPSPSEIARVDALLAKVAPGSSDDEARRALAELALVAPDHPRLVDLLRARSGRQRER